MDISRCALSPVVAIVAIGSVCFLNGCGETTSGEYSEYVAPSDGSIVATVTPENSRAQVDSAHTTTDSNERPSSVVQPQQKLVPDPQSSELVDALPENDQPPAIASSVNNEDAKVVPPAVAPMPLQLVNVSAPRVIRVLVENRSFKQEGPQGAIRVSYDDIDLLKVLNMDPVTPDAADLMPDWLKDLDRQRIRIRGFMMPAFQETGLEAFGLARDNQICCFGRDPKIYDVFTVRMRRGETSNYIQGRPFDVVGVFHVQPINEDGVFHQLYFIDDALVFDK